MDRFRVVSAPETEDLEGLMAALGRRPAIVLFGEGGFGCSYEPPGKRVLEVAEAVTRERPVTVVSTRNKGAEATAYIVRRGRAEKAQGQVWTGGGKRVGRTDLLYDVSPTGRPVQALIRICAEAPEPYTGTGAADLLLVPHAAFIGMDVDREGLFRAHRPKLAPHARIVTASYCANGEPVYDRGGRVVSQEREWAGARYHVAELRMP